MFTSSTKENLLPRVSNCHLNRRKILLKNCKAIQTGKMFLVSNQKFSVFFRSFVAAYEVVSQVPEAGVLKIKPQQAALVHGVYDFTVSLRFPLVSRTPHNSISRDKRLGDCWQSKGINILKATHVAAFRNLLGVAWKTNSQVLKISKPAGKFFSEKFSAFWRSQGWNVIAFLETVHQKFLISWRLCNSIPGFTFRLCNYTRKFSLERMTDI